MDQLDELVTNTRARRAHTDDLCDLIGEEVERIKTSARDRRVTGGSEEGVSPRLHDCWRENGSCSKGSELADALPQGTQGDTRLRLTRRGERVLCAAIVAATLGIVWLLPHLVWWGWWK